jgi:hypothetical protein
MVWTRFMDMHSGGRQKEACEYIHIEAPQTEATVIFYNMFGHNPERISCSCCGPDYSIHTYPTLEDATAYDRGCEYIREDVDRGSQFRQVERDEVIPDGWRYEQPDAERRFTRYQTLPEYLLNNGSFVRVIRAEDIKAADRYGVVPFQGHHDF